MACLRSSQLALRLAAVRPRCSATFLILCLLGAAIGGIFTSSSASAAPPQLKTPAERTVLGTVVNSSGAPYDGAVVYLQDTKSMVIRSYVANSGGKFHFNQLSPDTDYEVWAEMNKSRTKKKTISMFSSHLKFTYTFKIKS